MRKILAAAAFVLAAAAVPVASASAATTYHPGPQPAVVSSYTCSPYVSGYRRHHPVYGEACEVQVVFTGPQGEWKLTLRTPRPEELTGFEYGTTESSAQGSWGMNRTIYTPYTQVGYPDDYANGTTDPALWTLPAGDTANGYFWFNVPAGEQVPRVSIQAAS